MKTKMLVLGAFIAGILSAFFGGKAFATAGNTAEISSGTWEICVNATLDTQSPDFSLDITKSGLKSQLVLGGGECKTVKLTGSSAYTVSLGSTMGASSVNYEVSEGNLTFNVANSLNNYLNAFGSVTYTTEGSGEESDFELLFSMPGTCYLNGNANVSGDTCKDGDGNPLTDKKYIDTGVALFSEGNAARDFEIYFTLDDYASTQPNNQGTLFNAKYENSSMLYPGFTLRMSGSNVQTMELTGRIGNNNTDADKAKKDISTASLKGKEMKIVRVGGLVSYSIDGGELIEFQNYQNFSRYFEQNAVFGASLQTNGTPQRYYDGTVSNIRIYLKKLEEETTGNIVFDANGGTGTMAKIEDIELGTDVTLPANMFTKKNANFTGWNTAADGSGTAYTDEGTVTISEVGKLTLYAQWENIPVGSIEFNANGGSGTMSVIADIPVGTNATLPANTFTMKNGTFTGWNTAADGSGVDYADEATVAITSTSRIYLYAQWEIVPVGSIEFRSNGGSGTMAVVEDIPVGTDTTLPVNTYTLSSATFKGWNTRLDGTGTDYADGATITVPSTDRIVLYAQWNGRAILTVGQTANVRLKKVARGGSYYGRYTDDDSNIKAIRRVNALPDNFESMVNEKISANASVPIYIWFDNSDSDEDGQGDGVINVFTTANQIESWQESLSYLFYNMKSLVDIQELGNWNTSEATTLYGAFYGAASLVDISALARWDVSNVKSMSYLFKGASALTSVSALAGWNTSKMTGIGGIFQDATSLTDISALANWDTSQMAGLGNAFRGATSLSDISPLATWNTSKVTYLSYAFSYTSITNLDALRTMQHEGKNYISWDVSKVTSLHGTFIRMDSLTDISALASWNTSSLTDIGQMFLQTRSLSDISALASWDTSNVTSMGEVFEEARAITDISALASWNTSKVTSMSRMFQQTSITSISALRKMQHEGKDYVSWDTSKVTNMSYMFSGNPYLTDISALASWDISSVTNIGSLLSGAATLTDISALASWDTSNIDTMGALLAGTKSLVDISPIACWNTSKVTSLVYMFSNSGITNVNALKKMQHEGKDYVSWDTSNVTNMSYMFNGTDNLSDLSGISGWDVSNVTDMSNMFSGAIALTNVSALANWNTAKLTNMSHMFEEAKTFSDASGLALWNVGGVTDMSYMFQRASALANISGFSNWDTSKVKNMSYMFYGAISLMDVSELENWDVSSTGANKTSMFRGVPARPLPSWGAAWAY